MENILTIAIRLNITFDSIQEWLFNYAKLLEHNYLILRESPVSTETKYHLYMLLRDEKKMKHFLGKDDIPGKNFRRDDEITAENMPARIRYIALALAEADILNGDVIIGSVEVIQKELEEQIMLVYSLTNELQVFAELFFHDLCEYYYPIKDEIPMIDHVLLAEMSEEDPSNIVEKNPERMKLEEDVFRLRKKGRTIRDIAILTSYSESTIKRILKEKGLIKIKKVKPDP